jgi:hypothetical protein
MFVVGEAEAAAIRAVVSDHPIFAVLARRAEADAV